MEALEQPVAAPPKPAEPAVRRDFLTRLTSERAKELRRQQVERQRAAAQPPPAAPPDPFESIQRNNVRALLTKLNDRLTATLDAAELDAGAVDRLAAAWSKLGELERTLDGRPLPGSMRPRPERRERAAPLPGPE